MNSYNKLFKSAFWVTVISILIKILGLVKQSVFAAVCGATLETDLFFLSCGVIGQFAIAIFSSISISLLPIYTKIDIEEGKKQSSVVLFSVLKVFLPIASILSAIFCFFSRQFATIFAPSYSPEQIAVLSEYLQIMAIAFVPWCYFITVNVALEAHGKFLPGRFQAFFQNALIIIVVLSVYNFFGVSALIYAFLFSGIIEGILVTIHAKKYFSFDSFLAFDKETVLIILKLSIPLVIGSAVYEINDIVDKQLSTGLGEGMASILAYGGTINEIVTGIVVGSISVVLFGNFSKLNAEKKNDDMSALVDKSIASLNVIVCPILVMCVLCGSHIVTFFYGRGNFGENEIQLTTYVLLGYSAGFLFQTVRSVFSRVLYAMNNSIIPMISGVASVGLNILLSILLSKRFGVGGIAFATSVSMALSMIIVLIGAKRLLPSLKLKNSVVETIKGLVAASACGVAVYFAKQIPLDNVIVLLLIEGFICLICYCVLLLVFKSKPLLFLIRFVSRKNNGKTSG